MKLITAYVKPERLTAVKQSLFEKEVHRMTVSTAKGCGQQKGFHENYRGAEIEVQLLNKIRIEIAVNDEYVDTTVDAIVKGARTGKIGDGKIFVTNLEDCIRIRTGEKGTDAIG